MYLGVNVEGLEAYSSVSYWVQYTNQLLRRRKS
jgi:hypothetical protein